MSLRVSTQLSSRRCATVLGYTMFCCVSSYWSKDQMAPIQSSTRQYVSLPLAYGNICARRARLPSAHSITTLRHRSRSRRTFWPRGISAEKRTTRPRYLQTKNADFPLAPAARARTSSSSASRRPSTSLRACGQRGAYGELRLPGKDYGGPRATRESTQIPGAPHARRRRERGLLFALRCSLLAVPGKVGRK